MFYFLSPCIEAFVRKIKEEISAERVLTPMRLSIQVWEGSRWEEAFSNQSS